MLGALLGQQNGREVEIVNTFELAVEGDAQNIDHGFLVTRRDQCVCILSYHFSESLTRRSSSGLDKQVFPSLEFIGWYTVAPQPTARHIALHSEVRTSYMKTAPSSYFSFSLQFTGYCSTPLLLLLQPGSKLPNTANNTGSDLPFKAYEATVEIRERSSRSVFVEANYKVETGEAERIAVDWTARGGGSGTSREWD